MPTYSMFARMRREVVNGDESSSSTMRRYLYRVACVDLCVMVLMTLLACACPPHEVTIQDFPWHAVCMRVGAWGEIMFPLPLHVHEFVHFIKVQHFIEGTSCNPAFFLLAERRPEELTWAVDVCIGWPHYDLEPEWT